MNKKNNAGLLICIVFLILVVTLGGITAGVKIWETKMLEQYEEVSTTTDPFAKIEVDGVEYIKNPSVETVLFLGIDTEDTLEELEGYKHVLQSDFIALMVVDKDAETYTVLQINRDTMMDVSILSVLGERIYEKDGALYTLYEQVALAYNYGDGYHTSAQNVAFNIEELLNQISMDHYVVFGMSAIPILNDLVGGVEVTITEDLTDIDSSFIAGETVNLNGQQALTYIQSRMTVADGTNTNRMERQQEYLSGLYQKLSVQEDETLLLQVVEEASDYMFTDTTANTLSRIMDDMEGYEYLGFVEMEGAMNYDNEWAEFYIGEDSRMEVVIDLFYEER